MAEIAVLSFNTRKSTILSNFCNPDIQAVNIAVM